MADAIIRRAKVEDIKSMTELWWEMHAFNAGYDDRYYETKPKEECMEYKEKFFKEIIDKPNHVIWVAEDEGKIVGYTYVEIIERPPIYVYRNFAKIQEASITERYRGRGVFRQFFDIVRKYLVDKGIKMSELEIDLDNPAQMAYWKIKFYKRLIHMVAWLED
jgi:GNAT superfamily N-acetyltransferase